MEAEEVLVPKPRTTAPLWMHFGFKPNDKGEPSNVEEVICKLCRKKVSIKSANTTNLKQHLQTHHPQQYAELGKTTPAQSPAGASCQLALGESFRRHSKYKRDSVRWRTLTDSVTRFIAKEMQPFNTVEKPAFKEMLHKFDKQYDPPGKTYISKTAVPRLYNNMKDDVLKELSEVDFYSLTTDMWSSSNMTPFMSLTAHYLTADWTLQSRCLETRYTPDNHMADVLAESLQSALADWALDEKKISCITTDNGSNIKAAVRKLEWPWLTCFGHNLHLAVQNAIASEKEKTSHALGLCRSLVNTFNLSWIKRRDLKKAQLDTSLPERSLILDVATRWGTMQKMVERVLQQLPAIRRVLIDDRKHGHLNPTWQDVAVLESINAALKPVADFTDVLSGEKYVTVSSVKPVLELLKELLAPDPDESTLTTNVKKKMCSVLDEKYSAPPLQELLKKATFLNPRYKETSIGDDGTRGQILREIINMREPEEGGNNSSSSSEGGKDGNEDDDELPSPPAPPKKRRLCDLLQNRRVQMATLAVPKRLQAETELKRYLLQEELEPPSSDPLIWWRDNQKKFPLMTKLAKKYMCICATSTASERMFSTAGNIVSQERCCLKPNKVNMLVFLARNLPSQEE